MVSESSSVESKEKLKERMRILRKYSSPTRSTLKRTKRSDRTESLSPTPSQSEWEYDAWC